MSKEDQLRHVLECGIVAVVRSPDSQQLVEVVRALADGGVTVIADKYQGKRLNRPNDVVVKSDGAIYFTDPFNRPPAPPEQWEQPVGGVYRSRQSLEQLTS